MKRLFALDFDFTTIEEDSDHFVFKKLSPPLFDELVKLHDTWQWTDLMNHLVSKLQETKTEDDIKKCLADIPFDENMRHLLQFAFENHTDIIIISDANTFYIDVISESKGIKHIIKHVITNPAEFNPFRIKRHTIDPPHGCSKCAANLCKGKELLEFIEKHGPYDQVLYAGDGKNDFCPLTKLNKSDVGFPRNGKALEKMLRNQSNRTQINAQMMEWNNASELFAHLKSIIN